MLPFVDPLRELRVALGSAFPGLPAVKIGIVDGLPDLTHPVFQDASIEILTTMIPDGSSAPDPHGTGICSVVFGNSEVVQGIAPRCSGVVLPIFFGKRADDRPRPASQLDLARALTFALENNASIINVSAGQKVATTEADIHLEQALQRCAEGRALVIAAAGNDGCACLHLPAGKPSVLAVGAVDARGQPLEISNWGDAYRQNGLLAPGENLTVAISDGGVGMASGTSYATAVVSGVAALLLSVARRGGYHVDAIDVQRILLDSAAPCKLDGEGACDHFLAGALDAAAALAMLHRIGTIRQWSGVKPVGVVIPLSEAINDQLRTPTGRELTMTHSSLAPSDAATLDESGVTPSACSCRSEPEGDLSKTTVKQRSAPPATLPVVQSGALTGVNQQTCSCGGGQPPQIVYALGSLWFDFGTEARHDVFVQQLGDPIRANNPAELIGFLRENLEFTAGLTFILMQEQIPLYAVQPAGPFARQTYEAMLTTLTSSMDQGGNEQRISIPGFISGSMRLLNGMIVPTVFPDLRGMFKWRAEQLVALTREAVPEHTESDQAILNFLNRVYYELRNLGVAPQDRALNYAATNAFQARLAFANAAGRSLVLDSIKVVKSAICRPDSDCWDVELIMFDDDDERHPNWTYRFTIDVSEVIPVSVGTVRSWASRAK
jgi:cyanobactin maturation PatA/PatG family protease